MSLLKKLVWVMPYVRADPYAPYLTDRMFLLGMKMGHAGILPDAPYI